MCNTYFDVTGVIANKTCSDVCLKVATLQHFAHLQQSVAYKSMALLPRNIQFLDLCCICAE